MNIMLVEDSVATRKLMATLVGTGSHEPHHIFEAGSGEEALALVVAPDAPGIDLFLLDHGLPGMDGIMLAQKLREHFGQDSPNKPYIIMVTSNEREETINAAIEAGANDYVVKPVNLRVLQIRLRVARALLHLAHLTSAAGDVNAQLALAVDKSAVPIALCRAGDPRSPMRIHRINEAMATLLGVAPEAAGGQSLSTLQAWTPQFGATAAAALKATGAFGGPMESMTPEWNQLQLWTQMFRADVGPGTVMLLVIQQSAL